MMAPSISSSCAVSRRILATSLFSISFPIRRINQLWSAPLKNRRHYALCPFSIFQNLVAHGFWAGELLLVAQALEEYYFHFAGGQLLREVEEVRFNRQLLTVKGRSHANICDGPVNFGAENSSCCIDAISRQSLLLGDEIESWHDELSSLPCAGAYFAFERERPAEQGFDILHSAVTQSLSNSGTGDDHAVFNYGRHDLDFKIRACADFLKQVYVASLAVSETEIVTNQYGLRSQGIHQKYFGKVFGADFCQFSVELHHYGGIDPHGVKCSEALLERHQQGRGGFGPQHLRRMRVKRQHRAFQVICAGPLGNAAENFLMAEMDTIEIADGYDRAFARVAKSFDPAFGGVCDIQTQSRGKAHALFRSIGERQTCTSNFRPS